MFGHNDNYGLFYYCYLCLTRNNSLISVHHTTKQSVTINSKVKYIFPEMVSLDPEIPLFVCSNCLVTITSFYLFKNKCLENNKRLLHYVEKQKQAATNTQNCNKSTNSEKQTTVLSNTTATVFQNPDINVEIRDTILSSNRKQRFQATETVTVSQTAYRNLENGEPRSQTTKPATVFQNSHINPERQINLPTIGENQKQAGICTNAYGNLEKQNSNIPTANLLTFAQNTYKNLQKQTSISPSNKEIIVQKSTYRNPEPQNTITLSDEEMRTQKAATIQNAGRQPQLESQASPPKEKENNQPVTIFENAYQNQETQNTILISYDEENATCIEEEVHFNSCNRSNMQLEIKTEIEDSVGKTGEHTQQNSVLENIDIKEDIFSDSLQHDKLSIRDKISLCKEDYIEQNTITLVSNKSVSSNIKLEDSLSFFDECKQSPSDKIDVQEHNITFDNNTAHKFYQELKNNIKPESNTTDTTIPIPNFEINIQKNEIETEKNISSQQTIFENNIQHWKQEIENCISLSVENHLQQNSTESITNIRLEIEEQMKILTPEIVENNNSRCINKETEDSAPFYSKINSNNTNQIENIETSRPEVCFSQTIEHSNSLPNDEQFNLLDKSSANDSNPGLKPATNSDNTNINYKYINSRKRRKKEVKCSICPEYMLRNEMKKHMEWHADKSKFHECSICNKIFKRKEFKRHLEHHQRNPRNYQCSFCNRKYRSRIFYELHLKTHTEAKKFSCSHCDKKYAHEEGLKQHLLYHKREKKFECSICGKKYLHKYHCTLHERRHDRIYECKICNKTFPNDANLYQHNIIHIGEKKYECKICNKKFLQNNHLKQHSLTHTGVKDHVCSVCNKAFALPGSLRKHMETHNKPKSLARNNKSHQETESETESESEAETETDEDSSWSESKTDDSASE